MKNKIKNTIAIGDVHGRYHTFLKMLTTLEQYGLENSNLVMVGDYIDRGPFSKQVIEKVRELEDTFPNTFIPLKGNHEDMMWSLYRWNTLSDSYEKHTACQYGQVFMMNGGEQTLASYHKENKSPIHNPFDFPPPDDVLDWIENLPVKYEDEHAHYVHAGFRPDVSVCDQLADDCLWIRYEFLYHIYKWDKPIIHGHTMDDFFADERRIGIDTGAGAGHALSAVILETDKAPVHVLVPVVKEDTYLKAY